MQARHTYTQDALLLLFQEPFMRPASLPDLQGVTLDVYQKPVNLLPVDPVEEALKREGPIYLQNRNNYVRNTRREEDASAGSAINSSRSSVANPTAANNTFGSETRSSRISKWRDTSNTTSAETEDKTHSAAVPDRWSSYRRGQHQEDGDSHSRFSRFSSAAQSTDPVVSNDDAGSKWKGSRLAIRRPLAVDNKSTPAPASQWFYKDPQGEPQGPFTQEQMKEWYEGGFFQLSLPVRCHVDAPFVALGTWFADGKPAFLDAIPSNLSATDLASYASVSTPTSAAPAPEVEVSSSIAPAASVAAPTTASDESHSSNEAPASAQPAAAPAWTSMLADAQRSNSNSSLPAGMPALPNAALAAAMMSGILPPPAANPAEQALRMQQLQQLMLMRARQAGQTDPNGMPLLPFGPFFPHPQAMFPPMPMSQPQGAQQPNAMNPMQLAMALQQMQLKAGGQPMPPQLLALLAAQQQLLNQQMPLASPSVAEPAVSEPQAAEEPVSEPVPVKSEEAPVVADADDWSLPELPDSAPLLPTPQPAYLPKPRLVSPPPPASAPTAASAPVAAAAAPVVASKPVASKSHVKSVSSKPEHAKLAPRVEVFNDAADPVRTEAKAPPQPASTVAKPAPWSKVKQTKVSLSEIQQQDAVVSQMEEQQRQLEAAIRLQQEAESLKTPWKLPSSGSQSLADIQREEAEKQTLQTLISSVNSLTTAAAKWSAASPTSAASSLKQIQQEEAGFVEPEPRSAPVLKKNSAAAAIEAAKRIQHEQNPTSTVAVPAPVNSSNKKSSAPSKVTSSANRPKTFLDIQKEEEERLAAEASQQAILAAEEKPVVASKPLSWGDTARKVIGSASTPALDLRSIQAAEERAAQATASANKNVSASSSRSIASIVSGKPAVSSSSVPVTTSSTAKSLRDIQAEQSAAPIPVPSASKSFAVASGAPRVSASAASSPSSASAPASSSVSTPVASEQSSSSNSDDMFWTTAAPASTQPSKEKEPVVSPAKAPAAAPAPSTAPLSAPSTSPAASTSSSQSSGASSKKGANANKNAFGGPALSNEMTAWAKDEMYKLCGSSDMTLVSFLLTLDQPDHVREYCHAYLGNTPAVDQFAEDFCSQRAFLLGKGNGNKPVTKNPNSQPAVQQSLPIGAQNHFGALSSPIQPAKTKKGKK